MARVSRPLICQTKGGGGRLRVQCAQFGGVGMARADVFGLQVLELRVHIRVALLRRHPAPVSPSRHLPSEGTNDA